MCINAKNYKFYNATQILLLGLLVMIIRQESVDSKLALKDLPNSSPLPSANLVLVFGSVKRFTEGKLLSFLKLI